MHSAQGNETIARAQITYQGVYHFCMVAEHGTKDPNTPGILDGNGNKDERLCHKDRRDDDDRGEQ